MYAGLKAIEYCKISILWKRENLYDLLCEVSIENMNMIVVFESLLSFIVKLNSWLSFGNNDLFC